MQCNYCERINGHLHGCPLEVDDNRIKCVRCGYGIADGDDYVELDGEYYHKDCLSINFLLDYFNVSKGIMEYDENY